jgi:hypothetical protein
MQGDIFGGVTRRFPELRFAFLEGGVGWAASLLGDLASHWEKHNPRVLERFDPARLDKDLMERLFHEYGSYRQGLAQMRTASDRNCCGECAMIRRIMMSGRAVESRRLRIYGICLCRNSISDAKAMIE